MEKKDLDTVIEAYNLKTMSFKIPTWKYEAIKKICGKNLSEFLEEKVTKEINEDLVCKNQLKNFKFEIIENLEKKLLKIIEESNPTKALTIVIILRNLDTNCYNIVIPIILDEQYAHLTKGEKNSIYRAIYENKNMFDEEIFKIVFKILNENETIISEIKKIDEKYNFINK